MKRAAVVVASAAVGGLLVAVGLGLGLGDEPTSSAPAAQHIVTATSAETEGGPARESASTRAAELDFFEAKLVGGWSRYHSYDGSSQYVIFNADRTACRWERSGSGVQDESSYGHWELREWDGESNVFAVYWGDSPDDLWELFWFSYPADEVYFGAANLIGARVPGLSECFS